MWPYWGSPYSALTQPFCLDPPFLNMVVNYILSTPTSVEKAIGSGFIHFDEASEQYSGSPSSSTDHIFSVQERDGIQIYTFNLPLCLIDGCHLLCAWNEGKVLFFFLLAQRDWQTAYRINRLGWNRRDFCCRGNRRAVGFGAQPRKWGRDRPVSSVPKCLPLSTVGTLPAGQPRRDSCSRQHTRACSVRGTCLEGI